MDLSFLSKLQLQSRNEGSWCGSFSFPAENYLTSISPVNGQIIGMVGITNKTQYDAIVDKASKSQLVWQTIPAPRRGEIIRQFGDALQLYKTELGQLVSYEMGKSLQEGLGEVQEMIDICYFATGLSRQLYGLSMHSERPLHRMYEQWHPLGIVGVISAFNFPVAVWSWNSALAWVCGNVVIWKPSEKTPLCSIACQHIIQDVFNKNGIPDGVSCIVNGDYQVGEWMSHDQKISLVSATGSVRMGKAVGAAVGARLGKSILELGGNNAIIVCPSADLNLVLTAVVFGAVGTAGQRCTTTRRLIVHESIYDLVKEKLIHAYKQLKIGNPLNPENHVGPLIDELAVKNYVSTLDEIEKQGGKFAVPGEVLQGQEFNSGCYVKPCIAEINHQSSIVHHETFAPILYLIQYQTLEEAIAIQNEVPQGLSSSMMTQNLKESELFLSHFGSDCGIANVNIGTSGAEIGGAFGGEKETGGGRESGSDAWKAYMRRQTNTINYSSELPLAQGIRFTL
ncbi:MAG: aldehyde dehydrogenase family protein [Saprospiraceae bacterium]|nr:aldehyde dehydrogenase family protein [Saprospiraceae bacterium]